MKVVLTYPFSWPEVRRGGERLFHDLGVYLRTQAVDVVQVSTRGRRMGSRPLEDGVIRHRAFPEVGLPGNVILDRPVTYLPGAAATVARSRPDLVHGMFHLDGVAARLARPFTRRTPYVVHVQGMPRRENLERLRLHRLLFGPSVRAASAVIAVSRAAADAMEEEFGIAAVPLHNGVFTADFADTAAVDRAPEPLVFFPADPNDPRKRLLVLAEAVSRLDPEWQSCRLAVAGDPMPDLRAALIARLGDRLTVLGDLDGDGMRIAYSRSWITCLPAVREAFGLVIVEALASGRPCVAVRDGGVPEILGDGEGEAWLAAPDDADSLAGAISVALRDSQRAGIAETCRRLARPFDWEVRGPEQLSLYRQVLGR